MAKPLRARWTEKDMSLASFVENCAKKLPAIVLVTSGFLGNDAVIHTFSSDDVYLVCGQQTQPRAILRDKKGRLLSFPKAHKQHYFQAVLRDDSLGEPMLLAKHIENIIQDGYCPKFQVCGDKVVDYTEGAAHEACAKFGTLEFHDAYDVVYLVAYTIPMGQVWAHKEPITRLDQAIAIPAYMDIRVAMAVGMKDMSQEDFLKLTQQTLPPEGVDFSTIDIPMNPDIMLMPEDVDQYSTYTRPTQYVTLGLDPAPVELPDPPPDLPALEDSPLYDAKPAPLPRKPYKKVPTKVSQPPRKDSTEDDTVPPLLKKYDQPAPLPRTTGDSHRPKPIAVAKVSPSPSPSQSKGIVSELKDKLKRKVLHVHHGQATRKTKENEVCPTRAQPPGFPRESSRDSSYEDVDSLAFVRKPGTIPADSKSVSSNESTRSRYEAIHDIPTDLSSMSVTQVADCLDLLCLSKHIPLFEENAIDGCLLEDLDAEMLMSDLHFSRLDATRFARFIKGWRPKYDE